MIDYCAICHKFGERYTQYPHNICVSCCPDLPVSIILRMMNITYHEIVGTIGYHKLPFAELDMNRPRFWITSDENDKFLRCGTGNFVQQDNEINIKIIWSYRYNKWGVGAMKKFKQNFKRIRAGKPYY